MAIVHGTGGHTDIDFNMVASRPVVFGVVEAKVCEDCGRQFFRPADTAPELRQKYCVDCRRVAKPVGSVKRGGRGTGPRLIGNEISSR